MRLVDVVHHEIEPHLKSGDIAIDATVGNGHDTCFLAEKVGSNGKVYGFDVQSMAIDVTTMILKTRKCDAPCTLIEAPHQDMLDHLPSITIGTVSVVMFNLGYLPHGDKTLVTQPATTEIALSSSLKSLRTGGLISILSYRGHPGGLEEWNAVSQWIQQHCDSMKIIKEQDSDHPQALGPYLWILQKQPQG